MQNDHPSRPSRTERGFTLLELLVAIFILAIVMGLIFGTFEGVFSSAGHVRAGSELYEMADSCLKRISADLQALHIMEQPRYQTPEHNAKPDLYRIEGKNETFGNSTFAHLRFTSLAHLPIGGRQLDGIAEIVYYVQEGGSGNFTLRRSDKLYPYPEKFEPRDTDPILCEQVRSFKLVFFDNEGREHDAWNSQEDEYRFSTPKTIAVRLAVGDETLSYEFTTEVTLPMRRFISPKR